MRMRSALAPSTKAKVTTAKASWNMKNTDSGIVLVTDPRMSTKPYGSSFASSLPDCPKKTISAKQFKP